MYENVHPNLALVLLFVRTHWSGMREKAISRRAFSKRSTLKDVYENLRFRCFKTPFSSVRVDRGNSKMEQKCSPFLDTFGRDINEPFRRLTPTDLDSIISNSYYETLRGQIHTYLPSEHPTIVIWNNKIQNRRRIAEKVHIARID